MQIKRNLLTQLDEFPPTLEMLGDPIYIGGLSDLNNNAFVTITVPGGVVIPEFGSIAGFITAETSSVFISMIDSKGNVYEARDFVTLGSRMGAMFFGVCKTGLNPGDTITLVTASATRAKGFTVCGFEGVARLEVDDGISSGTSANPTKTTSAPERPNALLITGTMWGVQTTTLTTADPDLVSLGGFTSSGSSLGHSNILLWKRLTVSESILHTINAARDWLVGAIILGV